MAFNTRLKLAIVESGKAQIRIARETGIHESKLSRIIHGHDEPTDDQKKAIAKAVRKSIADLFPNSAEAA